MLEEHVTLSGQSYFFNVQTADYMSVIDHPHLCIVISRGISVVITTPYEIMKVKKIS